MKSDTVASSLAALLALFRDFRFPAQNSSFWWHKVLVNYSAPDEALRQDFLMQENPHWFFLTCRPAHQFALAGEQEVLIAFFAWDRSMGRPEIQAAMQHARCRDAIQTELRALVPHVATEALEQIGVGMPLQCFGTTWTDPTDHSHVTAPCFTLEKGRIVWDLPLVDGMFPAGWIFVGVFDPFVPQ